MKYYLLSLIASLSFTLSLNAQELNGKVEVNTRGITQSELSIFKTLENALTEFLNTTSWTGKPYELNERIDYNMLIILTGFSNERFEGTLQIQSSRPVFNADLQTTVLNFKDDFISFDYKEYQRLNFNPNIYENNLVSLMAFYAYTIIGLDADTFSLKGGDEYHKKAQQVVSLSSGQGFKGWSMTDGSRNRFRLNNELLIETFSEVREVLYEYHRNGLDRMYDNPEEAKQSIFDSLEKLETMNNRRPNSFVLRMFFDAKAQEIASIISGGPKINHSKTLAMLRKLAPAQSRVWNAIK